MTALALLLIGGGVFSAYAGITGQPVVPALRSVLSGKKPATPVSAETMASEAQRDAAWAARGPLSSPGLNGAGMGAGPDELARRLDALIRDAPGRVTVNSGYRSIERQAQLWAEAIRKYGSEEKARRWVAPPGKSNHNRGLAYDLGFENGSVKAWVHANAARYGLRFPMGHEPWHIELGQAITAIVGRSQPVVRDNRHLEHA